MLLHFVALAFECPAGSVFHWFGFGISFSTCFCVFVRLGELAGSCSACISFGRGGNGVRVANAAVVALWGALSLVSCISVAACLCPFLSPALS